MGVLLHGAGYVEAMDQKNSIEEQLFGLSQFKIPFLLSQSFCSGKLALGLLLETVCITKCLYKTDHLMGFPTIQLKFQFQNGQGSLGTEDLALIGGELSYTSVGEFQHGTAAAEPCSANGRDRGDTIII